MSDTMDTEEKRGFRRLVGDKRSRVLLIAVGGVVLLIVGYTMFFSSAPAPVAPSTVGALPPVPSVQAQSALSQAQQERLALADRQRQEEARATGQSALPTPVLQAQTGRLPTSIESADEEPREPEPERPGQAPQVPTPALPIPQVTPPPVQQPVVQQQQIAPQPQVDQQLASAMTAEMRRLMGAPPTPVTTVYSQNQNGPGTGGAGERQGAAQGFDARAPLQAASSQGRPAAAQPMGNVQQAVARSRYTVPLPGTMLYSRLVGRVNSDVPGPVLAEILQGPYTGARLLGSFRFSEQGVVLTFTSMTVTNTENGDDRSEVVPINAVAVDSKHLGTAMATDIDRHLFERVAVAFGTSFLEGLGTAIARAGSTSVVSPIGGATVTTPQLNTREQLFVAGGAAACTVGRIGESVFGNRRTTITVDAGTPFGLLFLGSQAAGLN